MGEQPTELALAEALRTIEHLRRAVDSHGLIGQATGVLVGLHHIQPETARASLWRASQNHNIKVNRIAAAVVALACDRAAVEDPKAGAGARQLITGVGDVPPPPH